MLSKGIVLKVENGFATVGVKRQSACDTCRANCGGHCDKASTVETVVKNTLDAKVGDTVRLYSSTGKVLFYASLVFILPLVMALVGFLIPYFMELETAVNAVVSVIFFIATYIVIWRVFKDKKSYDTIKMHDIV